jgi:predicted transport protein
MHINLKKEGMDDIKNLTRDILGIGHYGNGDFELQIRNDENLEYIMSFIKQSFKKNKP